MTITKARKILGITALDLEDKQIQMIIDCLDGIIEVGFQQFEQQHKEIAVKSCNYETKNT